MCGEFRWTIRDHAPPTTCPLCDGEMVDERRLPGRARLRAGQVERRGQEAMTLGGPVMTRRRGARIAGPPVRVSAPVGRWRTPVGRWRTPVGTSRTPVGGGRM
jgi:hypothetical protein